MGIIFFCVLTIPFLNTRGLIHNERLSNMIILYISALPKSRAAGPRHSVPRQIAAQAKFDDVYWINLNEYGVEDSEVNCNIVEDSYRFKIDSLVQPFNKPDLVVFEDMYYLEFCRIAYELRNKKIPYIIIPRGSLTKPAQSMKAIKKRIGNIFIFSRFIREASAIQYLTTAEYEASGGKWNKNNIIIPNGIDPKQNTKVWGKDKQSLKGVFIGRMNMYHKGLDFLIEACIQLKQELIEHQCTIELYGPDRNEAKKMLLNKIEKNDLENIVLLDDEIYGIDKERVLLNSDFFILTSRFEGQPMGLVEALSYGLPCLVSKGSNMANEIKKHDAGWIAETDQDNINLALKTLFNEKGKMESKGKNALNLSKQYDWAAIAGRAHKEYEKLLYEEKSNC